MKSSIKGVTPEWYTLKSEEGQDEPVRFCLVPLDGFAWLDVMGASYDPDTGAVGMSGIKKAARIGTRDWENIEDADKPGEHLAFSLANMSKLRPGWILEIGNRVLEISKISTGDSKNSDLPSS